MRPGRPHRRAWTTQAPPPRTSIALCSCTCAADRRRGPAQDVGVVCAQPAIACALSAEVANTVWPDAISASSCSRCARATSKIGFRRSRVFQALPCSALRLGAETAPGCFRRNGLYRHLADGPAHRDLSRLVVPGAMGVAHLRQVARLGGVDFHGELRMQNRVFGCSFSARIDGVHGAPPPCRETRPRQSKSSCGLGVQVLPEKRFALRQRAAPNGAALRGQLLDRDPGLVQPVCVDQLRPQSESDGGAPSLGAQRSEQSSDHSHASVSRWLTELWLLVEAYPFAQPMDTYVGPLRSHQGAFC